MIASATTRRAVLLGLITAPFSSPAPAQGAPRFPRGGRLLPGIENRISAQNFAAQNISRQLKTEQDYLKALGGDNPLLYQKKVPGTKYLVPVGPAKDQRTCGSCFIFAAIGAYEEAYFKANKSRPAVSEQEALDCTYGDDNCVIGGHHETVFLYLQLYGLIEASSYAYKDAKLTCASNFPRSYWAENWGYVRDPGMPSTQFTPSDAALKQALLQYGPLASMVNTRLPKDTSALPPNSNFKIWDDYHKRDYDTGIIRPEWPQEWKDGVFKGVPSKYYKPEEIDHDVLIVGWDDTLGGGCWIIRNSWGLNWGDEGFMKLPYGCNNIGCTAAWVTAWTNSALTSSLTTRFLRQ
jgi:hypothetical protein